MSSHIVLQAGICLWKDFFKLQAPTVALSPRSQINQGAEVKGLGLVSGSREEASAQDDLPA